MGLCKISFSVLCVLGVLIVFVSAQDSPQDYLNTHNAARSQIGVPNIVWDNTVANYAWSYANKHKGDCILEHSDRDGGKYGENLAGSGGNLSGKDAVRMWVDEKSKYNYNSNSCVDGECRHYTQVVWKNSTRLGCAKVTCDNNGGTFIGCNYAPPGNYPGEKPY